MFICSVLLRQFTGLSQPNIYTWLISTSVVPFFSSEYVLAYKVLFLICADPPVARQTWRWWHHLSRALSRARRRTRMRTTNCSLLHSMSRTTAGASRKDPCMGIVWSLVDMDFNMDTLFPPHPGRTSAWYFTWNHYSSLECILLPVLSHLRFTSVKDLVLLKPHNLKGAYHTTRFECD